METKELVETRDEKINFEERKECSSRPITMKKSHQTVLGLVSVLIVLIIGIILGMKVKFDLPSSPYDASVVDNKIINITPDIDVTYLNTTLKEASELTTAKLKIKGMVDFKDSGVMIVNKADFKMLYTADISAGIEMKNVKIEEKDIDKENKKIIVRIPKATVFKPNVYHGKKYVKFFDTKFALFNVNEKEDLSEAFAMAEKDAIKEATKSGLLKLADKQAETLIKGILSDVASPLRYSVEIEYLEEEKNNAQK